MPAISPNTPPPPPKPHASAKERRQPKSRSQDRKTDGSAIDREPMAPSDPAPVPLDAVFKGYEDVVGQDVLFRTENMLFHQEQWSSPSQHQSYLAPLPQGYTGQCGPGIKSLALTLSFGGRMSEPKIAELLRRVGVHISDGQSSHLLIKDPGAFHAEKDALYRAGLASRPWQHLAATSTRVHGQHGYCHIVCPPLYTASCTTAAKDRLTILAVLPHHRPRRLLVNAKAMGFLEVCGLSAVRRQQCAPLPRETLLEAVALHALLDTHLPDVGPQQRQGILDATAVAASHAALESPVVRLLVCDDAPQLTLVTDDVALCGVQEGRHEKTLVPYVPHHRALLEGFVQRFWVSYAQLLAYRADPTPAEAARLTGECTTLFTTVTGYEALDERIAQTRTKQGCLLMVLVHPESPLHNNPAALGARARGRKRDVSVGPRTREGATAWDTFRPLAETAATLGGSFYHDIHDRVSGAFQMPSLADLIQERATVLNLGASWNTS